MPPKRNIRPNRRCLYLNCCYLAEALECYGFKTDCVLYQRSNGEDCSEGAFHRAMDSLIDRTRAKHMSLPTAPVG